MDTQEKTKPAAKAAPAEDNTTLIELDAPIKRGNTEIDSVTLRTDSLEVF